MANQPTPRAFPKKHLHTSFGEIAYVEVGDPKKPPLLFVHGIPTSSYLWRHVLRFMQSDFHCVAPDLMGLGDTLVDPDAPHAMGWEAQAEMLVELMSTLGHERFAVMCHDQGGAAAQILAARLPDRLSALVLTDCVCFDNWPVPAIARLQVLARFAPLARLELPAQWTEWVETRTPLSRFRAGVFDPKKLGDEAIREYLRPMRTKVGRERFRRFLLAGESRHTELAVEGLRRFDKPTIVIWAGDDRYLSPSWGRKLQEEIPGAKRFELVPFCGHFWQEERPAEFASIATEFLREHLAVPDATKRPRKRAKKRELPIAEGAGR